MNGLERSRAISFACVVKETMTHTVYVHAANASEAREKAKDAGNWYDDSSDYSQDAPIVVRSVRRDRVVGAGS